MTEPDHAAWLRRAFAVARRARENGNHPFGAILVGPDGAVLMEQENAFLPGGDMTGHAERVLMTRASREHGSAFLRGCTMVTSAEPCAMCAGAAYWAGVGRVVFGLSERRLKAITGDHPENPTLDLPCAVVFAAGQRRVEVIGPLLEDEAAAVHAGAWGGLGRPAPAGKAVALGECSRGTGPPAAPRAIIRASRPRDVESRPRRMVAPWPRVRDAGCETPVTARATEG